ncbi:hypothetical protein WQ54_16115 [Bacillus sp. SA1-12]|uniref:hypothetical protein n=1 Tax=Bacillus sp. SA1-12 TaxID=1455638 RepID=UPI0006271944|nr:hypothetical protein [Bacillus sp. SA1-12]KKI91200.1 hypothetical protein WQ54_16115 [Bacillus sp. SA1-12]
MNEHFIAVKPFEHQIECFCPDGDHSDEIMIKYGDIIEVSKERKYVIDHGWYGLVIINNYYSFYMSLDSLNQYFKKGTILSRLDIELKVNYLNFRIDQSLDEGDEVSFNYHTKFLKRLTDLKVELDNYIHYIEENQLI